LFQLLDWNFYDCKPKKKQMKTTILDSNIFYLLFVSIISLELMLFVLQLYLFIG